MKKCRLWWKVLGNGLDFYWTLFRGTDIMSCIGLAWLIQAESIFRDLIIVKETKSTKKLTLFGTLVKQSNQSFFKTQPDLKPRSLNTADRFSPDGYHISNMISPWLSWLVWIKPENFWFSVAWSMDAIAHSLETKEVSELWVSQFTTPRDDFVS